MVFKNQHGIPDALNRPTGSDGVELRKEFEDSLQIRKGTRT
jgi:hypothetical protein